MVSIGFLPVDEGDDDHEPIRKIPPLRVVIVVVLDWLS